MRLSAARARVIFTLFGVLGAHACSLVTPPRVLFETRTPYNHIVVTEQGDERSLWFDNALQGSMNPADPLSGFLDYVEYFHCAGLFHDRMERVLFIGLGTGMGPKSFLHAYPAVTVDAVEIDPIIPGVAERFFGLQPQPRLHVHIADGARYVRDTPERYDLIAVDAYTGDKRGLHIPERLTTEQFFQDARSRLTDGGVLIYNVTAPSHERRMLSSRLHTVFPAQYAADLDESTQVFLALPSPPVNTEQLARRAQTTTLQKCLVDLRWIEAPK